MSDVSIGTVSSEVRIGLDKLDSDVAEAKSALASLAASLNTAVETFGAKMQQDAQAAVAVEERRAQAAIERLAAQQKAANERALAAAKQIGGQLQMMGGAALLALGGATKVGMDFETTLIQVANNTTMTTADIAQMTAAVKDLGRTSGADMSQLAEGFMHITNFGFDAADATGILTEAMKSAVSTGSDVGKTGEILANVMHEFSIGAGDAGRAMNVLHLAAAEGNMTLENLVEAGGPAFAMAANLGVKFTEVAAAMAALTKHGFTAAEAATQVRNILAHIAEPSSKAVKIMEQLDEMLGTRLVKSFQLSALHGEGMAGVLGKVKDAAAKANVDVSDLMMKLIQAMRGGVGAMTLAGTAAKDFKTEMDHMADAMSGKVDPTQTAFNRQQATMAAQVNKAKNELVLMAGDIERALLPALRPLIASTRDAAHWFQSLSPVAKNSAIQLAAFAGAAALVTGTVLKTIAVIAELKTSLAALAGMGGISSTVGAGGFAAGAGRLATSVVLKNPYVMAAGMMLATTNTGDGQMGDRNVSTKRIEEHTRNAAKALAEWQHMTSDARLNYVKTVYGTNVFGAPVKGRDEYDTELRKSLQSDMSALARRRKSGATGHPTGGGGGGKVNVNDFLASGGGGSGGSGGGNGSGAADELKQKMQEARRATEEVLTKLYEISHTDTENKIRQAWKDAADEIAAGVPKMQAYLLASRQIAAAEKERSDAAHKSMAASMLATGQADAQAMAVSVAGIVKALKDQKAATEAAEAANQRMYDGAITDLFGLRDAQQVAAASDALYWQEYRNEMEAAFHAQVQASIDANEAERTEREQTEQYHKDNPDIGKGKESAFQKTLKNMAGDVQSILGGAFERVFMGDTKNLLGDLLKSFEQMVAKMVADAIAAGIVRSLFGGGNFVTGFLGSLAGGGFDDGGNDRQARHWGYDFADMFTRGMGDHQSSRMALAAPGSGGGANNVTINLHGPVVRHETDIRELSRQMAREVGNTLRARPGSGK